MRDSFREIAAFMDHIEPATGVRRLLEMHQLTPDDGLREVFRRHTHPNLVDRRFLFWNTFLMDFLRGITPDSRRGRLLLGIFTLGLSEVARATEMLTATLGKEIWKRFARSPHDRPFMPAVEARSKEIGASVSQYSQISAFCEVWTNREKDWLINSWRRSIRGVTSQISERQLRSSGLVTVSNDLPITKAGFHRYNAESSEDKLVGKGVMLTRVNVGMGASRLEVYSTHLNAGNLSVKLVQFLELIQFISATHRANNPTILVGDFNLNAHDDNEYSFVELFSDTPSSGSFWDALRLGDGIDFNEFQEVFNSLTPQLRTFISGFRGTIYQFMTGCMAILRFKDLWKHQNDLRSEANRGYGYTTDLLAEGTADALCPVRLRGGLGLCSELLSAPAGAQRIDYMFVSDTNVLQSFTVDFSGVTRFRADRRAGFSDFEEMPFMSDHLGLYTTIMLVPRR